MVLGPFQAQTRAEAAAAGKANASSAAAAKEAQLHPLRSEEVILDASPSPLRFGVTMRKRKADSATLGLQVRAEAVSTAGGGLEFNLSMNATRLFTHLVMSLLQCLSREGERAWTDDEYRKQLWAAVDAGLLPNAHVYSSQQKKTGPSPVKGAGRGQEFTIVESEQVVAHDDEEDDYDEALIDEDVDIDDSVHSISSSSRSLQSEPQLYPRLVLAADFDRICIKLGTDATSGLDGGLRLDLRGLSFETIGSVDLPPSVLVGPEGSDHAAVCQHAACNDDGHTCKTDHTQVRGLNLRSCELVKPPFFSLSYLSLTPPSPSRTRCTAASVGELLHRLFGRGHRESRRAASF